MSNKYVIIIGSGIHKQVFEKKTNPLTDWGVLLESAGSQKNVGDTKNYTLDFELSVVKKTGKQGEKAAGIIENELLKNLSESIVKQSAITTAQKGVKYPLEIFNPKKVSDVISLNFDLVPELLITEGKLPKVKYCYQQSETEKNKSKKINNTRHRIIGNKNDGYITFWHPHGDIEDYKSLQLGIRKYGMSINDVELLRQRFKQNEKFRNNRQDSYVESWYDKLMNQPVIIVGASLSDNEWDIWFAIVNKLRNYGKNKNSKYNPKIYKMNSAEDNMYQKVFAEIIPGSTDIATQWAKLKLLLK